MIYLPFIKLDDIFWLRAFAFSFQSQCLVVKVQNPFKLLRGSIFEEVFGLASHVSAVLFQI